MRKLLYISLLAAASLTAASCTMDEDRAIFDLNKATAPTIASVPGATLDSEGEAIEFNFELPDYQLQAGKTYALYASADQAFTSAEKLSATIKSDGSVSVKQSDLNSLILNLGGEPDAEFTLYFRLSSWLATDKGAALESSLLYSNIVSATFIPYDMTVLDKDTYQHVWVQGNYCGWSHDKCQFLYNYSKDGKTFTGVVDFADKAADGIKFTDAADWNHGNWGSEAQAETSEVGSVQLIAGGSSKDIMCYSKRFYKFSLNTETLVLTREWGADQIGIVGSFNGWGTPDIAMNFNADYVRFWADVEFTEDTEFKFRADELWELNWGEGCSAGGANVTASAGKYRVYLDLNKGTIDVNEKMYGQPEPTASGSSDEPQPDKPSAWSIIGTVNGTSWDTDIDLTNTSGDTWVARNVTLTASDEFKIRADHDWTTSVGGPEANSTSTIDASNPYDVYKPTLGTAFATGDKNIQVGVEGVYDVTFDYAASTILIEEHKAAYSLIGEINGDSWSQDVIMTQNGDIWTSPTVNITGGFKIRYDYNWDNCYGAPADFTPAIGEDFTAEQPGNNITVPEAGDYKVIFNAVTKAVRIEAVAFPETMYMIGEEFGNWSWSSDGIVDMIPVWGAEGQFWTVRYFTAEKGFKFCSVKDWKGDFCGQTNNDGFVESGGNCLVKESGLYLVHIDLKNEKLHVEPARIYGIGECFGGWNEGMEGALFTNENGTASTKLANDGDVRMYVASSIATTDWWTREFIILDGKIVYRGTGDDQTRVACKAGQTVTLDFNAGTGSIN